MQPAEISRTQFRDKSYDILKGMLILIVVLGHSCFFSDKMELFFRYSPKPSSLYRNFLYFSFGYSNY